jgi:hypothetical protein
MSNEILTPSQSSLRDEARTLAGEELPHPLLFTSTARDVEADTLHANAKGARVYE